MAKSWVATLLIGVATSANIIIAYHETSWFLRQAATLEMHYARLFTPLESLSLNFHHEWHTVFAAVMAFISAWLGIALKTLWQKISFLAAACFLILLLSPALALAGHLFEPWSGVFAVLLAGGIGTFVGLLPIHRKARELRPLFVGRLTEQRFEQMLSNKAHEPFKGRRQVTVLNCSILNFAELSREMEPEDLQKMVAYFLKVAAEYLVSQGAYLEACNVQGVRVLFGATQEDEEHAVVTCRVALELKQRLQNLDAEIQNRWSKQARFGIALATGEVSLGLFGFNAFEFYSGIGEPVDLCRRLTQYNASLGSSILISEAAVNAVQEDFVTRQLPVRHLTNVDGSLQVIELLAEREKWTDEHQRDLDTFHAVLIKMNSQGVLPLEGYAQLQKLQETQPDDLVIQHYVEYGNDPKVTVEEGAETQVLGR